MNTVGLKEPAHDGNIRNVGNITQDGRRITQKRGDHRLGHEVFCTTHIHPTVQRLSAVNDERVDRQADFCSLGAGVVV